MYLIGKRYNNYNLVFIFKLITLHMKYFKTVITYNTLSYVLYYD